MFLENSSDVYVKVIFFCFPEEIWHVVCVVSQITGSMFLKITEQFQHLVFRPLNCGPERSSRAFEINSNDFQA